MVFFGKKKKAQQYAEDTKGDYLSLGHEHVIQDAKEHEVRFFMMERYEHIKPVLEAVRRGNVICVIDIHFLRPHEEELRRVVEKIKKTLQAGEGTIVGFHENWLLTAPKGVSVVKNRRRAPQHHHEQAHHQEE